jgi:hypothetical protein
MILANKIENAFERESVLSQKKGKRRKKEESST